MKKVSIVAFVCLVVGAIGTLLFSDNVFSFHSEEEVSETKQFDGVNIRSIVTNMDVGDINIKESENNNIRVNIHGKLSKVKADDLEFNVEEKADTLRITIDQKDSFKFSLSSLVNFNLGSIDLDIELPDKVFEKVEVATNVGDININEVRANELLITSDVGETIVNQIAVQQASVKSNVGDIEISEATGAFDIETDTGEVELHMIEVTQDISIESDVGDIEVTFSQQPENLIVDLKSDVGNVHVEGLQGVKQDSGKAFYAEIGKGGPTLKVKTDVGEITVEK